LIIGLKNQIPNDAHRSGQTQVGVYRAWLGITRRIDEV